VRGDRFEVLVVDDNADFLVLWELLLGGHPRVSRVRRAASAGEASRDLARHGPTDVVMADVWMAGGSGYELAELIQTTHPDTTIVLTSCAEGADAEALRRGATAFLTKELTVGHGIADLLGELFDEHRRALRARVGGG